MNIYKKLPFINLSNQEIINDLKMECKLNKTELNNFINYFYLLGWNFLKVVH